MSADLFAEFSQSVSQKHAAESAVGQGGRPQRVPDHGAAVVDDGWGDFEVAESAPPPTSSHGRPFLEPQTRQPAPSPKSFVANPMSHSLLSQFGQQQIPACESIFLSQVRTGPNFHTRSGSRDPNVLFDAEDFDLAYGNAEIDTVDDFGDLATAAQTTLQPQVQLASTSNLASSINLLGLEDSPRLFHQEIQEPSSRPQGALSFGKLSANHTRSFRSSPALTTNSSPDLRVPTPENEDKARQSASAWTPLAASVARQTTEDGGDEWMAWEDLSPAGTPLKPVVGDSQPLRGWKWDLEEGSEPSAVDTSDVAPPTNVPPPSVILSTFPELFNLGNSLFKPITSQKHSVTQQVLSDPKVVRFLQGYILLGITAAKVIAGRKHRWHRDRMLAKSMSISAAGGKGMKLAGVDKTQTARENREAADVIAAWREHVGRLRAAVATANAEYKANVMIPELSENMVVQTAKMVPTARWPCVICGLKREERVVKVDLDVQDSFGEWWVEHWGHRACKNFWLKHEQRLRQR